MQCYRARHRSLKPHFSTQLTEATNSKRVEAETTCRRDERTGHWEEKQGERERGMPANTDFVTRKHADEHKGATRKRDQFERVCASRSCEYSWSHITCWSRYIQPEQVEPARMLICGCGYRVLAVDYRWLVFGIFLLWYPLNVLTPFEAVSVLKISRPFYV